MRKRSLELAAVSLVFAVAAGCSGDDDEAEPGDTTSSPSGSGTAGTTASASDGTGVANPDLDGTEVSVFGPESSDEEAGAMQDALDIFAEEHRMTITYLGTRDFEEQINSQVTSGNPPDIAIFPQPGRCVTSPPATIWSQSPTMCSRQSGRTGTTIGSPSGRATTAPSTASR